MADGVRWQAAVHLKHNGVGMISISAFAVIVALLIGLLKIAFIVVVVVLMVRALLHMNREPSLSVKRPVSSGNSSGNSSGGPTDSPVGGPAEQATVPDATADDGPMPIVRRRMVFALLAGVAVLCVVLVIGSVVPKDMYRIASMSPGIAAAAVMLVLALPFPDVSTQPGGGRVRTASLQSREPWTYARRYVLMQPMLAAGLLLIYLGFTTVTASPDDFGLMRSIQLVSPNGMWAQSSSPYPGSYYSIPLVVVTLVLVGLTCAALWRIAHVPSAPEARFAEDDRLWRVLLTRFTVFLSVGAMLVYAAVVLLVAGAATVRVGINSGSWPSAYANDVYPTLGNLQIIMGGVVAVLAIIYLVMACAALVWLWTSPRKAR